MMQKLLFTISVILLFSFAVASAQSATLPDPGMLPDSPLYFLKTWKEQIQLFFTFDAEKKAEQYLHLAKVRLAEYQKMIEKGKQEIAEKTLTKYENQLNRALEKAEELKDKGKDVAELTKRVEEATAKHLQVLQEDLQKVPEAAKAGLERAIEAAKKVRRSSGMRVEIEGVVVTGGVECRRFQSDDGEFYTLVADDASQIKLMPPIDSPFKDGDRVRIEGRFVEVSYCMQDTTIAVSKITKFISPRMNREVEGLDNLIDDKGLESELNKLLEGLE